MIYNEGTQEDFIYFPFLSQTNKTRKSESIAGGKLEITDAFIDTKENEQSVSSQSSSSSSNESNNKISQNNPVKPSGTSLFLI